MPDSIEQADEKRIEANRLYWEDPRPVDEVAGGLAMSRSALYAAIVPLPTGVDCTACGGATVYPNRRHRSMGTRRCTACGGEETADSGRDLDEDVFDAVLAGAPRDAARSAGRRVESWRHDLSAVDAGRKRLIGGGAALGLLAGLAMGVALRRR